MFEGQKDKGVSPKEYVKLRTKALLFKSNYVWGT